MDLRHFRHRAIQLVGGYISNLVCGKLSSILYHLFLGPLVLHEGIAA